MPTAQASAAAEAVAALAATTDDASDWESVEADVRVAITEQRDAGAAPMPAREVRYHLGRYRDGAGWRTVITPQPSSSTAGALAQSSGLARIERAADGRMTAISTSGRAIRVPSPAERLAQLSPAERSRLPEAVLAAASAEPAPSTASLSSIERTLTSSATYGALRERLLAGLAQAESAPGSTDRFVRVRGDTSIEVTTDRDIGGITAVAVVVAGRPLAQMRMEYAPLTNGAFVRRRMLSDLPLGGNSRQSGTRRVEFIMENVVLTRTGGGDVVRTR